MQTQIGRVESRTGHSVLRDPSGAMKVTLHAFPDIGLIIKAPLGYRVPLERPRPEPLQAILTWLNSD